VLGNPPYVAMGRFKELKGYLKKRYEVVSDRADLSAYFFERGVKLLKLGGRIGYVSSATFFKTGSGAPLRAFLAENIEIENILDFGDIQIFDGVATLPMILTGTRKTASVGHVLKFWPIESLPLADFQGVFEREASDYPQDALDVRGWELEVEKLRKLREKMRLSDLTLRQAFGRVSRGIVTGLNEAFVISGEVKERLCREDHRSIELIQPFLGGKDLIRWSQMPRDLWMIYIPQGVVDIERYPAIRDWLLPFKEKLDSRATIQEWFEIQQPQEAYINAFKKDKICYPEFSRGAEFSIVKGSVYPNNKVFFFHFVDYFLLAILNSTAIWFLLYKMCAFVIGGSREIRAQYIETLPIPPTTDAQKAELAALAEAAQTAAEQRYALQQDITRRIPDLAPGGAAKLTTRLKEWWNLPDFAAFQAEIKKAFKGDIPLKDRNDWDDWITKNRTKIHALTAEIARIEAEINTQVYALFDLTPDEIALLEASI
jgi:TaqI-like C-terminal specificity domain/Eco57I restriction-modification methylase